MSYHQPLSAGISEENVGKKQRKKGVVLCQIHCLDSNRYVSDLKSFDVSYERFKTFDMALLELELETRGNFH